MLCQAVGVVRLECQDPGVVVKGNGIQAWVGDPGARYEQHSVCKVATSGLHRLAAAAITCTGHGIQASCQERHASGQGSSMRLRDMHQGKEAACGSLLTTPRLAWAAVPASCWLMCLLCTSSSPPGPRACAELPPAGHTSSAAGQIGAVLLCTTRHSSRQCHAHTCSHILLHTCYIHRRIRAMPAVCTAWHITCILADTVCTHAPMHS